MSDFRVRPAAACMFRHQDRLLVIEAFDAETNEIFYRLISGGIEFGETGQECIVRELYEELRAEIEQVKYLGTIEHIYRLNHQAGHALFLLYAANFVEPGFYKEEMLIGHEPDGSTYQARWLPIADFREGRALLGPPGLLALLDHSEQTNGCSHLISQRG